MATGFTNTNEEIDRVELERRRLQRDELEEAFINNRDDSQVSNERDYIQRVYRSSSEQSGDSQTQDDDDRFDSLTPLPRNRYRTDSNSQDADTENVNEFDFFDEENSDTDVEFFEVEQPQYNEHDNLRYRQEGNDIVLQLYGPERASARFVEPTDRLYGRNPAELQCPVCYNIAEYYRVFQCGHSVCDRCLRTMLQSYYVTSKLENTNATFNCPCCKFRIEHPLKTKIPFNLVLNSLMKKMLD